MEQETLEFEGQDEQEDDQVNEVPIQNRQINAKYSNRSIFELCRQEQNGNLELQPEYQRQQVWDDIKSSRLIESVLIGVPIPVIYLSEESDSKYSVIDGQQRLNAFIRFHKNELMLKGLKSLDLDGKKFKELSKGIRNRFENSTILVIEISKESDPDVKYDIFERLNTGAVQLKPQELRNCVYRGSYNKLINELSEDKDFQHLLGLEKPHPRMWDREMVLRFFAFYHKDHYKYVSSMKSFLNKEMEKYRNINENEEKELRRIFKKSVDLSKTVFGDRVFRRFVVGSSKDNIDGKWETVFNTGLYDVIMIGFTNYEKHQVIPKSDAIWEEMLWLMTHNSEFIDSISGSGTTSKDKIITRFVKWLPALRESIGTNESEPRAFSLKYKEKLFLADTTCSICDQKIRLIDDAEVDHIEQYWRGGKTIPSNARLTHRYCNRARSLQ